MNQLEDLMESSAADSDAQKLRDDQSDLEDEFKGFLETNKVNDDLVLHSVTWQIAPYDGG